MDMIVTRASSPNGIVTQKIGTLVDMLNAIRTERFPVIINPLGGSFQLKVLDNPAMLRAAQAAFPILFPTVIQALKEIED